MDIFNSSLSTIFFRINEFIYQLGNHAWISESYCQSWYSTWINKFDHILRLTHASAYIIMSSVSQKGKLRWRPEFIIIWCRFSLMLDNMWFDLGVPILALILLGGYDYINDTDSFHVLCWWIFLNYGFLIL